MVYHKPKHELSNNLCLCHDSVCHHSSSAGSPWALLQQIIVCSAYLFNQSLSSRPPPIPYTWLIQTDKYVTSAARSASTGLFCCCWYLSQLSRFVFIPHSKLESSNISRLCRPISCNKCSTNQLTSSTNYIIYLFYQELCFSFWFVNYGWLKNKNYEGFPSNSCEQIRILINFVDWKLLVLNEWSWKSRYKSIKKSNRDRQSENSNNYR